MNLENSFTLLRDIGAFPLNEQEEVRFSVDAYRGYRYVSVRKYVRKDGFSGPTLEGVTFSPEMIRALVPVLNALPTEEKQLKLGALGKFAKRPGMCVILTVAEWRGQRGLDIRQWEQDKGFTKKGLWIPLAHWGQVRQLFMGTLAALDEVPDIDF